MNRMATYTIHDGIREFETTDADAAEQYSRNGARVTVCTSE